MPGLIWPLAKMHFRIPKLKTHPILYLQIVLDNSYADYGVLNSSYYFCYAVLFDIIGLLIFFHYYVNCAKAEVEDPPLEGCPRSKACKGNAVPPGRDGKPLATQAL